jgi:hypothetical protein
VIPSKRLRLDSVQSGAELISDCSRCGRKRYTFKRDGLVVDARDWRGEKLFRFEQFGQSSATFVTALGLDMLTKQGFTNLCPRIAGSVAVSQ